MAVVNPWEQPLPRLDDETLQRIWAAAGSRRRAERTDGDVIPSGARNEALTSLAGTMRRRGMNEQAIEAALVVVNDTQCEEPLDDREVRRIARSVARYGADDPVADTPVLETGDAPTRAEYLRSRLMPLSEWAMRPEPEPGWVMGPFVVRGQRTIIAGPTGHGKSLFALSLARGIASGRGMLQYPQVTRGPVLVVDCEMGERSIRKRIIELGLEEEQDIHYWCLPDGLLLDHEEELSVLAEAVARIQPVCVVADPLFKMHGGDPSDNQHAVAVMRGLDRLRTNHDFALVIVAHMRKALQSPKGGRPDMALDDIMGAGSWLFGAEIIMAIQRAGGRSSWLHTWKHRDGAFTADGEPWEWGDGKKSMVTFTTEAIWQFSDSVTQEGMVFDGGTSVEDAVLEVLREEHGKWFNATEMAATCGRSLSTVRNTMARMMQNHPDAPISRMRRGGSYVYRWGEDGYVPHVEQELDL